MQTTADNLALGGASLIDAKALMSIRHLEMRARLVVEGFWHGLHRSPYHGFSAEFSEYRQYTPDDDPRYLDWRVYARSDRYFIKKFEEETNVRCYLLVDGSRSMSYGSGSYTKAEYASTLAATLAYFLFLQGDAVGLVAFDSQVRDFLPARHRAGHLRHIMLALEKPAAGRATDFSIPLRRVLEVVRKRGVIVVISDFLAPIAKLEQDLMAVAACGHEVIAFQTLDPSELGFDFDGAAIFEDLESGRSFFLDPGSARKQYLRNLEAHVSSLRSLCDRLGVAFYSLSTARPLESALFEFLRGRKQRQRFVRRELNRASAPKS